MQIKYVTTTLSAIFLALQASTPMVNAIPNKPGSDDAVGNMNRIYKRQIGSIINNVQKTIIDEALNDLRTCLEEEQDNKGKIDCVDDALDDQFLDDLTKSVKGSVDTQDALKLHDSLVDLVVTDYEKCIKPDSSEYIDVDCLNRSIVEIIRANS